MTRFMIINGDDFGYSSEVNQAIIKAHQQGILTSTSLMVTGDNCKEAVALAKTFPQLAVGLHLVLVCGKSVLSQEEIPHLVNSQGYFSDDPVKAGLRYQFSAQAQRELKLEVRSQLEKFCQTGLPLSHVDGHLHLHTHPVVLNILIDLAPEFGIKVIRLPYEELNYTLNIDRSNLWTKIIWSLVFRQLRQYGAKLLQAKGIYFTPRVYGLLQTGNMTEDYLLKLIPQIKVNCSEIYSHPTEDSQGKEELTALLSNKVKNMLISNGFELTNYLTLKERSL